MRVLPCGHPAPAEAGLEVWDPAEGARIGFLEDGTFAELRNDQLRTWTTPR
ncbi:hypothetical protein AB0J55_41020 [Amycolatopsis sp. NPDC049688]|uniref:hypothetical protein n=1 Tax=Amycolatopsis sp. NPDC049688 TaxID=3154733 RepID=UPI00342A1E70